jgi:hypothetical protein
MILKFCDFYGAKYIQIDTEYSFSVIGGSSSNKQVGIDFDKSMTDDWTLNASLESAKSSNSGYNNTIGFSTRMSF